jgi:transcriptional regulator with XRE-family HTH domain
MENFGSFVKQKRLERELGLREFSQRARIDPSNFSKMERGLLEPPQPGSSQLTLIREALELAPDSADAKNLEQLASVGRGMIPETVLQNAQVAAKLPAFFRTLSGTPISDQEREEIIKLVSEA